MCNGSINGTIYSVKGGDIVDFNVIVESIATVGFPIVMCIVLLYYMSKLTESHKEEINEMRKTIENNTLAIQHLADTMKTRGE